MFSIINGAGSGGDDDDEILSFSTEIEKPSGWLDRYDVCKCTPEGTIMQVAADSKLICPKCNSFILNNIINTDDCQIPNMQNKPDTKALRLFYNYWRPILGTEDWDPKEMPEDDYRRLSELLVLHNYTTVARKLTLRGDTLRKFVKELGLPAALNNHITKLLIHFGMQFPYTPTQEETDIVFRWYIEVIGVYDKIKERISEIIAGAKCRDNNITRPYYIYKIIEAKFPPGHKMHLILPFIHLQHNKTIEKNDLIWEKICADVGIQYIPTDKSK